ncbi:MAG: STAS domain-containing protein [Leptolyngbyaceae bacterium]|nr:STAS domain-containing protein [Leptolyngbyaceae bacterium]
MNPKVSIFYPSGSLDRITGGKLRQEVIEVVEAGTKTILIDFQDVVFMDSSGLGNLVSLFKGVRSRKGELCFCSLIPQVKMVFSLIGLDQVFEIYENQEEFKQATLTPNPKAIKATLTSKLEVIKMSQKVSIFYPSGNLDGMRSNQLRQEVIEVVEAGAKAILIDCQDVVFMDSSGLGNLVSLLKTVRSKNSELWFCSLIPQVKMIFELTRLDRVFKIYANQEEFEQTALTPDATNS